MDKIEEMVEEFIEKWRHESNIGVTLKELIERHGKLKTVGELFDAEMRANLQEIVEAVREGDKTYLFYCGNCRQPFEAKRGATMCPLCESHEISLMDFTSMKKEQADGEDD